MFAAIHLPDFEITATLRVSPEAGAFPCAVISSASESADRENLETKLPITALNHHARNLGIRPGWPLGRALVRCPNLKILCRQPDAEALLLREMIDLAESLTPDLEVTAPDLLILDLSRASPSKLALLDEFEIAQAELWHVRAPTPDLAHLAVLHEESQGGLINPGHFSNLPVSLLASLPRINVLLPMLRLWGLRTLGDFMKLPRQELIARLGPDAGNAHDILHERTCRLLRLHRPPLSLGQSYDFEEPVHLTEPLVFIAKRLLHTLSARVAASYLAVATLRITLHLESGVRSERVIRLPEPLASATELLRPIQTFLENLQLESSVTGMDLDATTTSPHPAQRECFGRQLPNPSRWADTLARLEALVGRENIGVPVSGNSHRPDDFTLLPPLAVFSDPRNTPPPIRCSIPLRRFRPPASVSVAAEHHRKTPVPRAILTGPHAGEIISHRGPFALSGDWWEEDRFWHRIEWDIQLPDRRLLRLTFSPPDRWQLEGIYA